SGRHHTLSRPKQATRSFRFFLRLRQQLRHVGQELFACRAFLGWQPRQRRHVAEAGQVAVLLPVPQSLTGPSVGLRVPVAERLAPPGDALAEPVECLPAPAGAFLVVQPPRVLALTATRQRGGAGGVVARASRDVFSAFWVRAENVAAELRRGGVQL